MLRGLMRFGELSGRVQGARQDVSEKPRHAEREPGLIITSDLCPVTPGLYEVVHLVAEQHVVRLGQSVISLLELDYPSRALAYNEG